MLPASLSGFPARESVPPPCMMKSSRRETCLMEGPLPELTFCGLQVQSGGQRHIRADGG